MTGRTWREACEAGDFYHVVDVDNPRRTFDMPGCAGIDETLQGVAQNLAQYRAGSLAGGLPYTPTRRVRLWRHGRTSAIGCTLLVEDAGEFAVPEAP